MSIYSARAVMLEFTQGCCCCKRRMLLLRGCLSAVVVFRLVLQRPTSGCGLYDDDRSDCWFYDNGRSDAGFTTDKSGLRVLRRWRVGGFYDDGESECRFYDRHVGLNLTTTGVGGRGGGWRYPTGAHSERSEGFVTCGTVGIR